MIEPLVAMLAFKLIDPNVEITVERADGTGVAQGETIASVSGPARAILTAERTALNFLCHLSGIATATASIVNAVHGHKAKIVCTRKTTPGLRAVEKYAVRAGGGANHRFGLDDAIPGRKGSPGGGRCGSQRRRPGGRDLAGLGR
jgi:nicotinate-nucleotide pyrophosphorylase (carboxylating)